MEKRYSQTEREALAVVWACEHFNIYISRAPFHVITDHQPLLGIWNKPNLPLHLARWCLRLQPYALSLLYRPGKSNPADYMSRHPMNTTKQSSREQKIADECVNVIANTSTPVAVTLTELKEATLKDRTLQTVSDIVESVRWHETKNYQGQPGVNYNVLQSYRNIRDELTVNDERNLILRNTQLAIPESIQSRIIQLAHEGHQGICRTKALIRSKVWFPGIDSAVEKAVNCCIPCQANTNRARAEPLNMSKLPPGPWLDLSVDFCGPMPTGEYLLVITDEYS